MVDHVYIERRDPARNMARFYALSIEPTLFGEIALVRRWGRIGSYGKRRTHHFIQRQDAEDMMQDLVRQKKQRGYSPCHQMAR